MTTEEKSKTIYYFDEDPGYETLQKIREQLNNKDIRIRHHSELLKNKLLYFYFIRKNNACK